MKIKKFNFIMFFIIFYFFNSFNLVKATSFSLNKPLNEKRFSFNLEYYFKDCEIVLQKKEHSFNEFSGEKQPNKSSARHAFALYIKINNLLKKCKNEKTKKEFETILKILAGANFIMRYEKICVLGSTPKILNLTKEQVEEFENIFTSSNFKKEEINIINFYDARDKILEEYGKYQLFISKNGFGIKEEEINFINKRKKEILAVKLADVKSADEDFVSLKLNVFEN